MIKKILFSVATMATMAMPATAQQDDTTKDFMYVVKNGIVVGKYEIGKDADYITFTKPETPQAANFVKYGDKSVEMKSAMVMSLDGYLYVFLSAKETIPTNFMDLMIGSDDYAMVMIPEEKMGEELDLTELAKDPDNNPTQAYYTNPQTGDPYGGTCTDDFTSDGFTAGTIKVEAVEGMVSVNVNLTNTDSSKDFQVSYLGSCVTPADDVTNVFNVDGIEKKVNSAFYKDDEENAVMDFYITSGNIESARQLEDCYQYAHIQVPYSALDGTPIDITAENAKNFKFDFIDNIQEQVYNLSNGNIGNATGTISVQLMTENTFKISVNIENFGTGRNFTAAYEDEFAEYSLDIPNAYSLQNQEATDINSAVVTHTDGIYTIYLSSKEDITTIAGMADADIVVEMPDAFMTNEVKGFSGTEDNAKISITYNGVKYNQANCSYTDDNVAALGGNARVNLTDDNIDIDFNVYNIYQYSNANLNGHYEGPVTKIQ